MRIITSGLFEAFGKCPTKCYHLSKGERATGNVFADWLVDQQKLYREEGFRRLTEKKENKQYDMGHLNATVVDLYLLTAQRKAAGASPA